MVEHSAVNRRVASSNLARGANLIFNPESKRQFGDILSNCWKRFTGNAPYVWERHNPDRFASYGPAVDGGVWNSYWDDTDPKYAGPRGNPATGDLQGIQNTVTNAVYLIAAQRIGGADPNVRAPADLEFGFFKSWCWEETPTLLWYPQSNPDMVLVRERVSHFKDGTPAPGFRADWAWTGDQGLVLSGFADRISIENQGNESLLEACQAILLAARTYLADDGVLQPWTEKNGEPPAEDAFDYCTGTEVFWRNVLYVFNANPDLRNYLRKTEYQEFIKLNAQAVLDGTAGGQSTSELDGLTNDVAVLVAAIRMLQP